MGLIIASWLLSSYLQAQPPCSLPFRPVIFVHGFLGSGDNWAIQIQRFQANGYCKEQLFTLDWNSLGSFQKTDSLLNQLIDSVIQKTGQKQVDLVGHSAGAMVCYKFLKDPANNLKVAHYVHIAGTRLSKKAGNDSQIPTMTISGKSDKVVQRYGNNKVDIDFELDSLDHLALATDAASFRAMYRFFNEGKDPMTSKPQLPASGNPIIGGKVLMMGSNLPVQKESVWVYPFDEKTGKRISEKVIQKLITDDKGYFSSFINEGNTGLEFTVTPKNGRSISYFYGPQAANNEMIYLRCLPQEGMVTQIFKNIPVHTDQSTLAIFSSNHAMIAGRDSVSINHQILSTPSNMPAEKTAIACFVFDDGDGKSSLQANPSWQAAAFLMAVDYFIPAQPEKTIELSLNHHSMHIPCRPSSETIMIAVFN